MNKKTCLPLQSGVLLAVLLPLFAGCIIQEPRRYPEPRAVVVQPAVVIMDDYDYYPSYGIYYSRNRHEYVYIEGNHWVRRSEPRGVTVQVLLATPTARMNFRDAPEYHHTAVVQSYPKDWGRQENSRKGDHPNHGQKNKDNRGDPFDR